MSNVAASFPIVFVGYGVNGAAQLNFAPTNPAPPRPTTGLLSAAITLYRPDLNFGAVALLIGVPVPYLQRVDQERQPLPMKYVKMLAQVLGVGVGTAQQAVALVEKSNFVSSLVPLAPDQDEPIQVLALSPTGGGYA